MRITRQADYAIRTITYLARQDEGRVVTVEEISEEMLIPRSFTAKIVQRLTRAGITNSTRGVKGGFVLKRTPESVTLLDVVEAIDGPVDMNICVLNEGACSRIDTCEVHPVWVEIQNEVAGLLKKRDFRTLLNGHGNGHAVQDLS